MVRLCGGSCLVLTDEGSVYGYNLLQVDILFYYDYDSCDPKTRLVGCGVMTLQKHILLQIIVIKACSYLKMTLMKMIEAVKS